MGIKIPSNFLMVGWGSGRQAEQTCCLHLLVMCLPPRAEVIQKSPSNLLVPPPGQVMGSILVPWRTGGALGDLGMGGVFPPAASQLNSLRLGAARGGGPNPFSRLQLPFQAIELEALLSASRPKRDQEGWKQTSAGTAEPLASQDGRSPLASLPASALALQSVVPEPPWGSSETENLTCSNLPRTSHCTPSIHSPSRAHDAHGIWFQPLATMSPLPALTMDHSAAALGLLSVLPLLQAQDLCTCWSPTQDAVAPDTGMAASSSSQVTCSLLTETLPYHSVECALPFTLHITF